MLFKINNFYAKLISQKKTRIAFSQEWDGAMPFSPQRRKIES
jgi:hypothetical protein